MTGVVQLRLEEKREPVAAEKVGSGADPVVYEKLRLQGELIATIQSSKVDWTAVEERLKQLWDEMEGANTQLKSQLMDVLQMLAKQVWLAAALLPIIDCCHRRGILKRFVKEWKRRWSAQSCWQWRTSFSN